jgi:hypothetical protein
MTSLTMAEIVFAWWPPGLQVQRVRAAVEASAGANSVWTVIEGAGA